MSALWTAFGLGVTLGLRHALEADHVAAVCTFVARDGGIRRAALSGALWGIGHGAVLAVAAGILVALGARVPEALAVGLEMAVAAVLVGLGVVSIRAAARLRRAAGVELTSGPAPSGRRTLAVGVLHGASGTAALVLLVATSHFGSRIDALAFVGLFALASALAMTAVAALVAVPVGQAIRRAPALAALVRGLAGAASIGAGIALAATTLTGERAHEPEHAAHRAKGAAGELCRAEGPRPSRLRGRIG